MRIRYRNKGILNLQRAGAVLLLLIPFSVLGTMVIQITNLFNEIPGFGVGDDLRPDPSTFLQADYTRLSEMAEFYASQYEDFHMPLNFTVGTTFSDASLTVPTDYHFSDNGALWTGTAMAAFVGKYIAGIRENNVTLKADALRVIERMVDGMAMMLKVPNGGLGPEYGATVARAWAGPEDFTTLPGCSYLIDPNRWDYKKFFNGSGPYSQYRWSDYTSNDEYGGYYMGIALGYKYLRDEPSVNETLALIIDQLCTGMLNANFLGIGGFGGPTGVDQKMKVFGGASWMLLVLKMGAIAFPDKYEALYYHTVYNELQGYFGASEGGIQEIVSNYYAFNFGIDICFGLLMLEDDPLILQKYLANFEESMWYYVRYHRNPYFNAIYLAANRMQYNGSQSIERDVEDQLMELDINHFPDVYQGIIAPGPEYELVNFTKYQAFFNTTYGALFAPIFMDFDLDGTFYNRPRTAKMMRTSILMWDRNPFELVQSWENNTNLVHEEPGISFLAPYWIMRGFIGMPAEGVRDAWIPSP